MYIVLDADSRAHGARKMRIIAGKFRGRRLHAVGSAPLRPTSDRLRETLFDVLAAIQLDNDRGLQANEVTNIRSDWTLAAKFKAVQLTSSQALP